MVNFITYQIGDTRKSRNEYNYKMTKLTGLVIGWMNCMKIYSEKSEKYFVHAALENYWFEICCLLEQLKSVRQTIFNGVEIRSVQKWWFRKK